MSPKRGGSMVVGWGRVVCLLTITAHALAIEPAHRAAEPFAPGFKAYTASEGAYRVTVPARWELTWTEAPSRLAASEFQLAAPDEPWPGYVTITIRHYASAHRTAERHLFDLQQPGTGDKEDQRSPPADLVVAAVAAKALEVSGQRYPPLGMSGEKVPSFIRHVVVPARQGFFVLRYDAPQSRAAAYRGTFDRMVESFAPRDSGRRRAPDPISRREYEVFAALFTTPLRAAPDVPQFFDAVQEGRLVLDRTMTLRQAIRPDWPGKEFGALEAALIRDYGAKNRKGWPLTDGILVKGLAIVATEELNTRLSSGLQGRQGTVDGDLLRGGIVSLSRVGFDKAGDTALLGAAISYPGAMSARYLVLMRKIEGGWTVARVAMENLIQH